jgi:hypothetical protein
MCYNMVIARLGEMGSRGYNVGQSRAYSLRIYVTKIIEPFGIATSPNGISEIVSLLV